MWLRGAVILCLGVGMWFGAEAVWTCTNSQCRGRLETSPVSLVTGLVLIGLMFVRPDLARLGLSDRPVGLMRRAAAMMVDFGVVAGMTIPFVVLALLLVEAAPRGAFAWRVSGDLSQMPVSVMFSLMLALLAAWFAYFWLAPSRGRPTLGQYVLGYGVRRHEATEVSKPFLKRALYGAVAFVLWPLTLLSALGRTEAEKRVEFWWGVRSGTRAVSFG